MADEAAKAKAKAELTQKLKAYVDREFNGDYKAAFSKYAGSDDQISPNELKTLLKKIGIGNGLTRGMWVDGILETLDKNADSLISWQELSSVANK